MDESMVERLFRLQRESYVFEEIIRSVYESVLHPGDVSIDGGANIGDHTIPMSKCVGLGGKVYAYEPVPATVEVLKRNLTAARVDNVEVRTKALGAESAISNFIWVENRATRSALKFPSLPEGCRTKEIDVEIVVLDEEIMTETRPIRFVKLDLEGGEYDCLRGAKRLLSNHRPVIIFENGSQNTAANYGYSEDAFFELFAAQAYSLVDLFGRPYGHQQWGAKKIPYYTIAISNGDPAAKTIADAAMIAAVAIAQR